MEITTIGLDLAKSIFQIHAVDASGAIVVRKALRRAQVRSFFAKLPPSLIGMEACDTSHHWARELTKLRHEVKLMPPAYVEPYMKRGKTDAADAQAICEAVTRPNIRIVPVKSAERQAALALHRTRDLLVKQCTQLVNMVRGLLAGFGIERARGLHHALDLARRLVASEAPEGPALAQRVVTGHADQIGALQVQLAKLEKGTARLASLGRAVSAAGDDPRRPGQPVNCLGPRARKAEWDLVRVYHQGQRSNTDRINRPHRRLHPTNAKTSNHPLQRGSHPQRTVWHRPKRDLEPTLISSGWFQLRSVQGWSGRRRSQLGMQSPHAPR